MENNAELKERLTSLLNLTVGAMVKHKADFKFSIEVMTSSVEVHMTAHRADMQLVLGSKWANYKCADALLSYIAAQYKLSLFVTMDEPTIGEREVIKPMVPATSFNPEPTKQRVEGITKAIFGCNCGVRYDSTGKISTTYKAIAPAGVPIEELRAIVAAVNPLLHASGKLIGWHLFFDIIPSEEVEQPQTSRGRYAEETPQN